MYNVGDKFYYTNKRTGDIKAVEITDIQYRFDSRVCNQNNLYGSQIDELLERGELSQDIETMKQAKIAKLEKELGIKLKEVK